MKSPIANAVLLGLAATTALVVGCSSTPSTSTGTNTTAGNTANGAAGAISMKLSLGGDTSINAVNYTLQNGTSVVQSGTLSTANSAAINFELGSIPSGPGYTVTLSAASPDGGVNCLGTSGVFSVIARQTVTEQVQLICTSGVNSNGMAIITGLEAFCGTWQSVSTIGPGIDAGPTNGSEVFADGVTPIVISATANGAATTSLKYNWSVLSSTGGGVTLGANNGNGTTSDSLSLVCNQSTQAGGAVIQLVVTDSDDGGAVTCPTALSTVTVPVTCDAVAQLTCAGSTPNKCGTGSTAICTNTNTDSANCGTCGTACAGGQTCQAGVCACPAGAPNTCGTACVNEQTDPANCGTCGHACTGGQSCVAGACSTVCTGTPAQCACNAFVAAHEVGNTNTPSVCNASELAAFSVDFGSATAGACLDCMLGAGQCLNNPSLGVSGQDCEDPFSGNGAGETTAECTAVVNCDFGVTPPAVPAAVTATGPGPIQGYCGSTPVPACESGSTAPAGACKNQIVAGFPSTFSASQIGGNIASLTYASGRAGAIVGCAQNSCTSCLAGSVN